MTTSTAIGRRVPSNLAIHTTHLADGQEALDRLPSEGARAGRSTGTTLGGVPNSTFAEDSIVRNELCLTLVEQRRNSVLATEWASHLKDRHLDMLDSWEASIKRRLASAWISRHSELLQAAP